MTWGASTAYGQPIALGPVQARVLSLAMDLTSQGRRPELTLHAIAARIAAPVSSVHDALGRLRALGLLGVAVRMGRHGGHRLWRVTRRADRDLDARRHRQAVARLVGRFGRTTQGVSEGSAPGRHALRTQADPIGDPPPGSVNPEPGDSARSGSSTQAPLDPFLGTPMPPAPERPSAGEWEALPFAEKMRRAGYRDDR